MHVGPGDESLLHQLAQADVDKVRHAGAAHRRHAALERRAQLRQRRDVHVRIDQTRARHSGLRRSIARTPAGRRRRTDAFDRAAAQDDGGAALHGAGADVDDARRW